MDSNPEPQATPGSGEPVPRELIAAAPSEPAGPPADADPAPPAAPLIAASAPPPPERRAARGQQQRNLSVIAAIFLLVGSAFVGFGARDGWFTRDTSSTSVAASPSSGSSSGSNPSTVDNSSDTSSNGVDFGAVADHVDDAIVNITSTSEFGVGAGTGMIISSKGLVLTNHHVISGAEDLSVEVGGNGDTYDAHVVGYSIADDVALVQIEGVSGLPTIDTDDNVVPQDSVLVMGNALGRGGEPTVSSGQVVALDQEITATDETGQDAETLTGMIQIAASVQPGQSGGAVVNADGEVVGMTTAASVNGSFRVNNSSGEAYAIPITRALAAIQEIERGESTASVHVGPRAVMGISIQGTLSGTNGRDGTSGTGAGVPVAGVTDNGPAAGAGIAAGATIVGIGDTTVTSVDDITKAMNTLKPGDEVKVTWLDGSGTRHSATVELDEGPPA
ncbi:MAG: S1C family serine protease [Acidimicrobiia bacterium]